MASNLVKNKIFKIFEQKNRIFSIIFIFLLMNGLSKCFEQDLEKISKPYTTANSVTLENECLQTNSHEIYPKGHI